MDGLFPFGQMDTESFSSSSETVPPIRQHVDLGIENMDAEFFAPDKTFVISLGGSTIAQGEIHVEFLKQFAELINRLHKEGYHFVIVVGGGRAARDYCSAADALQASNFVKDEIGIRVTRLNAFLVIQALEHPYPEVLKMPHQAKAVIVQGKIPVFGGFLPGITTDACAALVAESLHATFVNISDIDGVYSENPKDNPDAEKFTSMTHDALVKVIAESTALSSNPSQNCVLDLPASMILKRSKIKTIVASADSIGNLENLFTGQSFQGTTIETEDSDV
jgi:uridylate kinase